MLKVQFNTILARKLLLFEFSRVKITIMITMQLFEFSRIKLCQNLNCKISLDFGAKIVTI